MTITRERSGILVVGADKIKRDKLRDLIRRVIANPQHINEVTNEIALDWFPTIRVSPKGHLEIIVGSGRKR